MGSKRNELNREEVRSIGIVGVSLWAVFLVVALCLWVGPKHFGVSDAKGTEGVSDSFVADGSSEGQSTEESTEPSTEESTEEDSFVALTELPAEWDNATAKDYLQQMFFTDVSSWTYQFDGTISEFVTNDVYNATSGVPGGIWRTDGTGILTEEVNILTQYYSLGVAQGIYITEQYRSDVEGLAEDLSQTGVHVNIIPSGTNLSEMGVEGIQNFVKAMHSKGISAGVYCEDMAFVLTCINENVPLDCVVMPSGVNENGMRPCIDEVGGLRRFFTGAILMESSSEGGGVQKTKDLIHDAIAAGCDGVAVRYKAGDQSNRAIYAYRYLLEQDVPQYDNDLTPLKEHVLRLLNLKRK